MGSFFSSIAQHIAIIFTIITLPIVGFFHGSKMENHPVYSTSPVASESAKPSPTSSPAVKVKKSIVISSPQPTTIPSSEGNNISPKNASQLLQERQSNSNPTPSQTTSSPSQSTVPSASSTSKPSDKDLHCPKITKIEDSLGNTANTIDGLSSLNNSYLQDVKQITITIYATDPQNLPLYYQYGIGNNQQPRTGNLTDNNWIQDNKITVDASPMSCSIDPSVGCGTKNISYSVDDKAGYNCSASGVFEYKIIRIPQ